MRRSYLVFGGLVVIAFLAIGAISQAYYNPPTSTKPATVDELLDRLESLKAKREAIHQEESKTQALLMERLKAQKERMKKVGVPDPSGAAPPLPPPATTTG